MPTVIPPMTFVTAYPRALNPLNPSLMLKITYHIKTGKSTAVPFFHIIIYGPAAPAGEHTIDMAIRTC